MAPTKVLFVFGTRPEAIKLAPVLRELRSRPAEFEVRICVTAQHRSMLDQVLAAFEIVPDHDLNLMQTGQSLSQVTARVLEGLEPVLASERPDMVLVQGDTTTTMAGALAAFHGNVPVGHVEAGLRTGDPRQPFPEEMNRVLAGRLATLHFAPTPGAAANLRAEGVAEGRIAITGNTGIDAVLFVRDELEQGRLRGFHAPFLDPITPDKKLLVVTTHRRESFGDGMEEICRALAALASRDDVCIVLPVHPNPQVAPVISRALGGLPNVRLVEPLDYVPFVDLMRRAHLLLTDSGGVQEEGPSLGKPVLVLRGKTERPEGIEAGAARLIGTGAGRIVEETGRLLDDPAEYRRMARVSNPYGDGHASRRIADAILEYGG